MIDYTGFAFGKGTTICRLCGDAIQASRKPSAKARQFCSVVCRNRSLSAKKTLPRVPCKCCGKPMRFDVKACSRKCAYELRKLRTRTRRACSVCGEMFWPVQQSPGVFERHCSRRCADASRVNQILIACFQCRKNFFRGLAAFKRVKRSFCSRACCSLFNSGERHINFRGDADPNRGAGWHRIAEAIRVRDGHCCRRCGQSQAANKRKLDVDHIRPWRSFDDKTVANHPSNLVSLCKTCHNKKTQTAERDWLRGDRIAMLKYEKSINLPPLFADVRTP